jgi:uncharacterized protein YukE
MAKDEDTERIVADADAALKKFKDLVPRLDGVVRKLEQETRKCDVRMIRFQLEALSSLSDNSKELQDDLDSVLQSIDRLLTEDSAADTELPRLEPLYAKVGKAKDAFDALLDHINKAQGRANDTLDRLAKSAHNIEVQASDELIRIEGSLRPLLTSQKSKVNELFRLADDGIAAVEARNAPRLADIKSAAKSTWIDEELAPQESGKLAGLDQRFSRDKLSRDFLSQLDHKRKELEDVIARIGKMTNACLSKKAEIEALEIKAVDPKKAAAALGIDDPKAIASLKKALAIDAHLPLLKALEELSRNHKLDDSAKGLEQKLNRARLL